MWECIREGYKIPVGMSKAIMMCGKNTGTNCPRDRADSFSGSEKNPSVINGEKDAVFVTKEKNLNVSGRSKTDEEKDKSLTVP